MRKLPLPAQNSLRNPRFQTVTANTWHKVDQVTLAATFFPSAQPKGIYRLLESGELLESRDALYSPGEDQWIRISSHLVGTPYQLGMGPIRRFNK